MALPAKSNRNGPARSVAGKAMAVVRAGNPVRPAHPVRSKNDCGRQVSWLTGRCASAAFSGDTPPMAAWPVHSPLTVAGAARALHPTSLLIPKRGTCRGAADKEAGPSPQAVDEAAPRQPGSPPAASTASDRASTMIGNPALAARSAARRVGADMVTSSGQLASAAFSTSS